MSCKHSAHATEFREEASQLNELQEFRSRYGIPTVPGFVHIADGQISVRCDSSMSAQEIKEFAGL